MRVNVRVVSRRNLDMAESCMREPGLSNGQFEESKILPKEAQADEVPSAACFYGTKLRSFPTPSEKGKAPKFEGVNVERE
jgi:hypothetical protein